MRRLTIVAALLFAAACVPKKVHEEPIIEQGDKVGDASEVVADASARASARQAAAEARSEEIRAAALADCAPAVCDAVVRGELALGMNQVQVMAATGTTETAWSIRSSGESTMMTPKDARVGLADVVGNVAMVQISPAGVSRYGYVEGQGIRLVSSPADATMEGRAAALADAMVREGDELAARGRLDDALNRYDRASILTPGDPMIDYKIATVLDKALRPYEALIQYQLFLHRMELEKIEARGDAAAKLAEAIALAQQRIVVLERQTR
jgi:hypothetical protein